MDRTGVRARSDHVAPTEVDRSHTRGRRVEQQTALDMIVGEEEALDLDRRAARVGGKSPAWQLRRARETSTDPIAVATSPSTETRFQLDFGPLATR